MSVVNISCYKFVTFNECEELKDELSARCVELGLKGTILLAPEGINVFLAGTREAIDAAATNTLDSQLDMERDMQRELGNSQDYAEGVRAFIGKRPPVFVGQ